MSGALPTLASGLGIVQVATSFAGRTDLANAILFGAAGPVILGSVGLTEFEVPERIRFGGRQRINVHTLPGGQRFIDAMGRDDAEIAWQGIFLSGDAEQRAQTIDAMRVAGAPVPLSWGTFSFTVVVAEFEADYRNKGRIDYRIICTVLQDSASSGAGLLGTIAAALAVAEDINSAIGQISGLLSIPAGASVPSLTAAQIATVNADLAAAQTNAQAAAQAGYQLGSASYNLAVSSLQTAQADTETLLDSAGTAAVALAPTTSAVLAEAFGLAGVMAAAAAMRGFVGRAATNAETGAV